MSTTEIEQLKQELSDTIWMNNKFKSALMSRVNRITAERDAATAKLAEARGALEHVLAAIKETDSSVLVDDNWNPDAHVEIVLTVAECQAIARAALARLNGR